MEWGVRSTRVTGRIQCVAHPRTASKVPEITVYFWIIKILTTGMGETTSDFLIHKVGLKNTPGLIVVVLVTGLALAACLLMQIAAAAYQAPLYWLAVVMVGIFGTMSADGVHVQLGVPYIASTAFFGLALRDGDLHLAALQARPPLLPVDERLLEAERLAVERATRFEVADEVPDGHRVTGPAPGSRRAA